MIDILIKTKNEPSRYMRYGSRELAPYISLHINRVCHAKSPICLFSMFIYIWQRPSATPKNQSNVYMYVQVIPMSSDPRVYWTFGVTHPVIRISMYMIQKVIWHPNLWQEIYVESDLVQNCLCKRIFHFTAEEK